MEDFGSMLTMVLEQVRQKLLREVYSPGPTHIIAVIEIDQVSKEKIGIRYYLGEKEYVIASSGVALGPGTLQREPEALSPDPS